MFTKPFSQLSKKDADIAGGKGASLGEMLQSNIPVPDGYVVLSTTFDEFLHTSDLAQEIDAILESVDHKTISSVESASEKIQELIKHATMPDDIKAEIESQFSLLNSEFVAVRSSATAEDGTDHAWAGQLESYLNTTQDTLLEKVQHCWASLFTPRAIFYRFEKGLDATKISVAVVVQKMVNSEKSGIAFSVHPVTEDRNQIIIEAGFGLGEAIVSGSVTPDSYVISKQPREIIDINISNQTRAMYRKAGGGNEWLDIPEKGGSQVFTDSEILALSEIIMTIEDHYGFPCDIEWAYENGKFYIVQSRPITTLSEIAGPKISFEKAYTRDTTMIIQQGWNACVTNPFYASGTNPFTPPVIHYMNDGVIEIWENEKATQWIMDSVQNLIKSDEAKLISLVDQYEKDLIEIKEYWAKGPITDVEEFGKYVDRVFVVMKGFDCMYFPSVDERTPAHIRERMLKLRDADTYFDSNDKLMRASLIALYPELKGYENCILKSEIKNPPSLEILKVRKKSFVVIGEEFAEQTTIRKYLAKHPEYHLHIEIPPADSSTLIGQVGNKGYAKGIVRIMKRKEQISEAQEGDIIVSTMTTPDFVPAMQKAAAIITDEGGITCHAAIVARELNKPCVIGTKFATEILKDGDEVGVDADNGIVKILSKNSLISGVDTENYQHFGMWKCNPFAEYFWVSWFNKEYLQKLSIDINESGVLVLNGGHFFVKKPVVQQAFQFIEGKINKKDMDFFDAFVDFANDLYRKSLKRSEDALAISDDKKFVLEVASIGREFMFCWFLGWLFCEVYESRLESEAITSNISVEKISEYIPLISTPLMGQQEKLRELKKVLIEKGVWEKLKEDSAQAVESVKSNADLMSLFDKHLKEFSWIQMLNFLGDDITVENLIDQMTHLNDKSEKHSEGLNTPESFAYFATVASRLSYLRQTGAEYFSIYTQIVLPRLKNIASSLGLSHRELLEFLPEEINALVDKNIVASEIIERRKNESWCVYADEDSHLQIIDNDDTIKELVNKMTPIFEENNGVIKGQVGNKGIATGKVKVILANTEFDKMEIGDVLVTTMTTPDFVILMQKASAIVTDIGGLLCHAAIVSREINKPCVIGTKNGTQILKDGDMVEVDANKGTVTKLS